MASAALRIDPSNCSTARWISPVRPPDIHHSNGWSFDTFTVARRRRWPPRCSPSIASPSPDPVNAGDVPPTERASDRRPTSTSGGCQSGHVRCRPGPPDPNSEQVTVRHRQPISAPRPVCLRSTTGSVEAEHNDVAVGDHLAGIQAGRPVGLRHQGVRGVVGDLVQEVGTGHLWRRRRIPDRRDDHVEVDVTALDAAESPYTYSRPASSDSPVRHVRLRRRFRWS